MTTRTRSVAAVLAAALFAFGCGGDSSGPETELTQTEALAVFSEVVAAVFSVGFETSPASAANAAAMDDFTINGTYNCEGGGAIALSGLYTTDIDENGTGTYTFNVLETPNGCGITTQSGSNFVVNGNPNIQMTGTMTFDEFTPLTFDMTFTGGLAWAGDPGSGSCTWNLTYDFDLEEGQGTMNGNICGHTISSVY